jgi:chorismate dehydratase
MATKLRLGRIDYVNADPFFCQHPAPDTISVHPAKPDELNRLLSRGELDFSWVSSIELLRHPEEWILCPYFCIAAPGPVRSVVLTSPIPLEELSGATVWLTRFSATSIGLLKVLLASRQLDCHFETYDHRGPLPEGPTLLIGDEALRMVPEVRGRYCYDLAELWKKQTGLPMVFAVPAMRRELLDQPDLLEQVDLALDWMASNLRSFLGSPVCSRAFQQRQAGLSAFDYQRYFAGFCFEWNSRTEAGFEAFRSHTSALDLCLADRMPDFYDPCVRAVRCAAVPGHGAS